MRGHWITLGWDAAAGATDDEYMQAAARRGLPITTADDVRRSRLAEFAPNASVSQVRQMREGWRRQRAGQPRPGGAK